MQEHYPRRRTVGVVAFALGLAALGTVLAVGTLTAQGERGGGADPTWTVLGLAATMVLVAVAVLGALAVRLRQPGPSPRLDEQANRAVLVLPRSRVAAAGNAISAVAVAALPVGLSIDLLRAGSLLGAAVVVLPGLFFLTLPLFWALGRWVPGGLELTGEAIEQRRYGSRVRVAWDDVLELGPLPGPALVDTTAAPVWVGLRVREAEAAYTTPWFRNGRLPGAGEVALDLRDLGAHPATVHAALEAWWRDPALRAEIGTPASLRRLGAG